MIYYYVGPAELTEALGQEKRTVELRLPSGGILLAEPFNVDKIKVVGLVSTDPADFLDARFQPGNIINKLPRK